MAGLLTAEHSALQGDIGATAPDTARRVEEVGYAALPGVVSARWLDSARSLATTVNRPDAQEVLLEDMTAGDGEAIDALLVDPELAGFLESVATRLHPRSDPADRHVDVSLRIVNGPDEGEQPLWFHYDATVVTVVFPIEIPATGGELVLHANRRPFRRLVLTNIVEKMVMQSNAYRRRFHAGDPTAVSLVPVFFRAAGFLPVVFLRAVVFLAVVFLRAVDFFRAVAMCHLLPMLRTPCASGVVVPVRSCLPTRRIARRDAARS